MAIELVNELEIHVRDKHETDIGKSFLVDGYQLF